LPDVNENPVIESFTETSDGTVSSDDNFDMMGFDAVDNVNPDENVDVVSDDFSMPEFDSSSSSPDLPDLNDTSFDLPDFDFGNLLQLKKILLLMKIQFHLMNLKQQPHQTILRCLILALIFLLKINLL